MLNNRSKDMKYLFYFLLALLVIGVVAAELLPHTHTEDTEPVSVATTTTGNKTFGQTNVSPADIPAVTVIAEGFEIPWDIAFLPDGDMLVTERPGDMYRVSMDGAISEITYDATARHRGEGGLLGVVLHPNFDQNNLLYVYLTAPGTDGNTINRIERYRLEGTALINKETIITDIPGAIYHDGGRMAFGPDGYLYVTTGDATQEDIAQDLNSLGGKILRMTPDGAPAPGNPFNDRGGNAAYVYSYGHRNPQGLAWDASGNLWETEHGRSGIQSGLDEINLIQPGQNYGWPKIEGDETQSGMVTPAEHSGADVTWAPASLAYLVNAGIGAEGSLFFGGLRGEALYEALVSDGVVIGFKTHFKGEYGRIRTVHVGPDGMLYMTTSNRDGRGNVRESDDKIIRVNPAKIQ